ncbi:hypothetical protein ACQKQD_18860 [Methylobacterium sp. NPDC080182]|uniref:hypothetical protein n=1 Tax=Methylobacterium sp. NPDC080182 TaxID=3390590 RepID=UPI003D00E141
MVASSAIALQHRRADAAKKRARVDRESPVHIAILDYLRATLPHGWRVKHTPNKPRSMQQGRREKRMGAIAGWPDLDIIGPADFSPSIWFLEVKPPIVKGLKKEGPSDVQLDVHDALGDLGHAVKVVRSVEEARQAVRDWRLPSNDMLIRDTSGRAA